MTMQSESQLELPLGRQAPARRRPRKASPAQAWGDAAAMPYLGRRVILRLDGARDRAERIGETLYLPLPPEAGEGQIRDRAEGWLQGEARRLLGERLEHCARGLGLPMPAWQLAFTAGLAVEVDAAGRFRLPWRLTQLAPEDIDRRLLRLLEPMRSRAGARDIWDAAAFPA
jgi:predicted metal-dependent hydrolase